MTLESTCWFMLAMGCVVGVSWLWEQRGAEADLREMIRQHERAFPGSCFVCWFHRASARHGFNVPAQPKPHRCCEERQPKDL